MKRIFSYFLIFTLLLVGIQHTFAQQATSAIVLDFTTGYDATITLTTPNMLTTWTVKTQIVGNATTTGSYVLFNGVLFPSTNYTQTGNELIIHNTGLTGHELPIGNTTITIRVIKNPSEPVAIPIVIDFPVLGGGNGGNGNNQQSQVLQSNIWQTNQITDAWLNSELTFLKVNATLGIGNFSTIPNSKLSVMGNISVFNSNGVKQFLVRDDGYVFAREVQVKLGTFPDYVFTPNYQLMPLQELSKYIQKNQHLPNIPSATQIETNGIGLGELVRLQQEKIEELTLYLIQLKKEVDELKSQK